MKNFLKGLINRKNQKEKKSAKDFENKHNEAQSWAIAKIAKQERKLKKETKKGLKYYKNNFEKINNQLLNDNSFENEEENKNYNEIIKEVDYALENSKVKESFYTYKRVNEKYFYEDESFIVRNGFREWTTVNRESFDKINNEFVKNNFEHQKKHFFDTSLSKDSQNIKRLQWKNPILLKIKVAKNDNALHLKNSSINEIKEKEYFNHVVLPRDSTFQYKKASIINENGLESILIETNLIKQKKQ